ncbi:MAG: hydrolase [Sandaracinaceae bacterium]
MIRALAQRARRSLHGHYWTYAGFLLTHVRPPDPVNDAPVDVHADDPQVGHVPLTARLGGPDDDTCVIVLHGLGGDIDSRYVQLATHAAQRTGRSTLRLGFRGSDRSGADVYHAGLIDDLVAAIASPALARFSRLEIVGYSMGGHIALRYAALGPHDPRVRAIAAVCAPLDLARGVRAIQRPDRRPYQFHVLQSLKACYREVDARARREGRALPFPATEVDKAPTLREWDAMVVCPRFGFRDPDDYYERASAGPLLGAIDIPTLVAIAEADPMVPPSTLEPWLGAVSPAVTTWRFERGGHVAFPVGLRRGEATVEDEVIAWLRDQ